jgi:hypothetical protein
VQRKTWSSNVSATGLRKWKIVLALAVAVVIGAGSSCKKTDSANENTENGNANETASSASPSPTDTATPAPATATFQGTWVNQSPTTANNTKLVITQNDSELKVHAWGKCTPTDCDWGEQSGGIVDDVGVVTWDQGFVIRKMKLTLEGNNQLRSVTESVYNDNRPRRRSEEVFVKQS